MLIKMNTILMDMFKATTEPNYSVFPDNLTTAELNILAPTLVTQVYTPSSKMPNFSTYIGLFVCLLLFLLVLIVVMLYRLKHTIAPLPTNVESASRVEEFTDFEPSHFELEGVP